MKPISLFWAAAMLALAGGCAATTVHSKTSADANLSSYRTFAFATPNRPGGPTAMDHEIRAALTRNLQAKGLVPATNGQPDLLVAYHCRRTEVPDDSSLEYDSDWGGRDPLATYEVGTLLVDFVDPRTNAIVWRGSAKRTLDEDADLQHPDAHKLDHSVAKLIARYPVQLAAEPRTRF